MDEASEALTADIGNFDDGDQVMTTSQLRFRSAPSSRASSYMMLPRGARILVTAPDDGSPNPSGPYYHVEYNGQTGWAHGYYLAPVGGSSAASSGAGVACMREMAEASRSMDGRGSQRRCYHYVKRHIGAALGIGFEGVQSMLGASYQPNAYDFARWLRDDPGGRASRSGFVRANIPLDQLPVGAILVWRPGQCGYSSSAGHIEVNVGGGRACSDFCGRIKTNCGAPTVVLYNKGC